MNTYADPAHKNSSKSIANTTSKKLSDNLANFHLVDNRPEAVTQRKLQEIAINSPQVRRLTSFHEQVNNSSRVKQSLQLQAVAADYAAQQQLPIQRKANINGPVAYKKDRKMR